MGEVVPWDWDSVFAASSSSSSSSSVSCIDLLNNNDLLGFRDSLDLSRSLPHCNNMMEDDDKYLMISSPLEFPSSGYLEDALLELGRPKRRRLLWPENSAQNFNAMSTCPDQDQRYYVAKSSSSQYLYNTTSSSGAGSSSSNSARTIVADHHVLTLHQHHHHHHPSPWVNRKTVIKEEEDEEEQRAVLKVTTRGGRRVIRRKRVAYPFALVKPGGGEGEVTIEEINRRILMAPMRPVRHPVGEYACRPSSAAGGVGNTGLSGKAVVALTRIYTQGGKGTVTIIRTKG